MRLVARIIGILRRVPSRNRHHVLESLGHIRSRKQFEAWVATWRKRLRYQQQLPSPPIPGDDVLRPLTSVWEMRRESLRMRNCAKDYVADVLSGDAYLCHWNGLEPATVMLENDAERGWVLAEALGIDNTDLCEWTLFLIRSRVWDQRRLVLGRCDEPLPKLPVWTSCSNRTA